MALSRVIADLPGSAVELRTDALKRGPHVATRSPADPMADQLLLSVDLYGAVGIEVMGHELQVQHELVKILRLHRRSLLKLHSLLDRGIRRTIGFVAGSLPH